MKLTVKKIESKLKALTAKENARRRKRLAEAVGAGESWNVERNQPLPGNAWTSIASLNWQVKNHVFKGCNGKAVFDPIAMSATSYDWWQFVRVIKGKVVFNAYRYSVTTGVHQGSVASLLRTLGVPVYLEVDMRDTLSQFEWAALEPLYSQLFQAEVEQGRKGAKPRTSTIRELKARIKKARLLGAKCSKFRQAAIKTTCTEAEVRRLARVATARAEGKAMRQAETLLVASNVVVDVASLSIV